MPAQMRRRARRRTVVFVRTDFPAKNESIALAPPVIDAGGDCDFTCAQCGKVLAIADKPQLANVVFYCQACDAYNTLGGDPAKVDP